MLRRAYFAKDRAVGRQALALQDFAAPACRITSALDLWQLEFDSRVIRRVLISQLHAGERDLPDASPLAVAGLHHRVDQPHSGGLPLRPDNSGIAVDKEGLSLLKSCHAHSQSRHKFRSCKARADAAHAAGSQILADRGPDDRVHMARIQIQIRAVFHGFVGARHCLVRCQNREVRKASFCRRLDSQTYRRRRRLKSHR